MSADSSKAASVKPKKVVIPKVWKRPHSTIYGKNVEFGSKLYSDKIGEINGRKFNSELPWQMRNSGTSSTSGSSVSQGYLSKLLNEPQSTLVGSVITRRAARAGASLERDGERRLTPDSCASYADVLELTNPSRYSRRATRGAAGAGGAPAWTGTSAARPRRIDFHESYLDDFNAEIRRMNDSSRLLNDPLMQRRAIDGRLDFNYELGLFVPAGGGGGGGDGGGVPSDGRRLTTKRTLSREPPADFRPSSGGSGSFSRSAPGDDTLGPAEWRRPQPGTGCRHRRRPSYEHETDINPAHFNPVITSTKQTHLLPKHACQIADSPYGQSVDGRKLSLGSINPHSYRPSLPHKTTTVHASDGEEFEFQDRSSPFYTDRLNVLWGQAAKQTEDGMDRLERLLDKVGQRHLLKFYHSLDEAQRGLLEQDILGVDWRNLSSIYREQVADRLDGSKLKPVAKIDQNLLQELPAETVGGTSKCSAEELSRYSSLGCEAIKQGKVAALLLAGGQGTRLGVDYPKGMVDIGLPSGKSLFQLQAERIIELNSKACGGEPERPIIWYLMTSEATTGKTKDFFCRHKYFGLNEQDVVFFEQNTIPCFDFEGKVLLGEKHRVSRSPNGNGGLYEVLHEKKIIDHMVASNVEYVHVYCVDNVLVRVCDPSFIGFCIDRRAEAGAKVVEKKSPNESVGTICKVGNQFKVIEYSEISDMIANKRDPATGKLTFSAGNICEHFFRVDFLKTVGGDRNLRYHLAIKKIPHVSLESGELVKPAEPNGVKLERFIFDVFELTDKFAVWEVERDDQFSPVKNADGNPRDTPTTARAALLRAYELGLLAT